MAANNLIGLGTLVTHHADTLAFALEARRKPELQRAAKALVEVLAWNDVEVNPAWTIEEAVHHLFSSARAGGPPHPVLDAGH